MVQYSMKLTGNCYITSRYYSSFYQPPNSSEDSEMRAQSQIVILSMRSSRTLSEESYSRLCPTKAAHALEYYF
jgi:hypothetical protein